LSREAALGWLRAACAASGARWPLCIALNKLDEALRELGPGFALVVTPEGVVVDVVALVPMSRGGVA
jgi:hypothetical protein